MYRYVEIGSINVSTGEIIPEKVLGKDLPANAKRVLKKGDVIVSKVRTYRGGIAIVQEDGYIGSGAFCVLRENGQINKETLLACLRSKLFLRWSWKPNTGTSYPTLHDNDILDFPIPVLSEEKQAEIEQKVSESFNLRKRGKRSSGTCQDTQSKSQLKKMNRLLLTGGICIISSEAPEPARLPSHEIGYHNFLSMIPYNPSNHFQGESHNFMIRKANYAIILLIFAVFSYDLGHTHPGRTDANGGHYNRQTGEYHKHVKEDSPAAETVRIQS